MVQFVFDNWKIILLIYGIGALITFVGMIWFWIWIIKAEEKEAYLHPDEYEDESMFIGVAIAIITSVAVSIIWMAIPLICLGLLFYNWIVKTFPDLMGCHYFVDEDEDEEEEQKND